ncbi:hypothetical protein R1flu_015957 [Riccia fluitans]|uniref:Protein CHAPERONE-LIKE PROTEIN OF POR1, chloroplastic n=1 Tax=Riccia fluitans TaxID=41844 RepID=A0ABD1YKG6_9MARC
MAATLCSSSLQQYAVHPVSQGMRTGGITALGMGGSNLSCGASGRAARNFREIQGAGGVLSLGQNKKHFHSQMMRHVGRTRLSWDSPLPRLGIRAMDASVGGEGSGAPQVFPRINVKDPFKRLGISRDASEEEIRDARNYLCSQYGADVKSRDAIESAYDKIIMDSFRDRKKNKVDVRASLKKKLAESPPWVKAFTNRFEVPDSQIIILRFAAFFVLGVWSVLFPGDGGPTFQVAVSFATCIYFLKAKLKSLGKAFLYGFGALVFGWVSGTFLVPVVSSYILPSSWSLELSTSLYSYVVLWAACTFLK